MNRDAASMRLTDGIAERIEAEPVGHGLGPRLQPRIVKRVRATSNLHEDGVESRRISALDHLSDLTRAGHGRAHDPQSPHLLEGPDGLNEGRGNRVVRAGLQRRARTTSERRLGAHA